MAGPNVSGMVNDPDFQGLAPSQQREALFKLTGDSSFNALSDGDTLQFVSKMKQPTAAPIQQPTTTISATPQPQGLGAKISSAASNFATDLQTGSNLTMLGRGLHKIGVQPLQAGQGEKVGDFMGSAPLGATQVVQGGGQIATSGQRLQGAGNVIGGALKAATIPAGFIAPDAGEAAAQGAELATTKAAGLIPAVSKARGGALFNSVAADANKVPVAIQNAQQGALDLISWQQKAQLGPSINKFLNRITSPAKGPLTYEEARDYYQLLGKLSADEASKLAPAVQRSLATMVNGLKVDIGNAAAQVGRGEDYYRALAQSRYGYQGQKVLNNAIKYGATIGGTGVVGGYAARLIADKLTGH